MFCVPVRTPVDTLRPVAVLVLAVLLAACGSRGGYYQDDGLPRRPKVDPATVPDAVPQGDLRDSLNEAMGDLPEREKMILQRRFGLEDSEPETLADIAKDLGITAERVRQLQNAALQRLQKPAKLRQLSAFVE